MRMQDHNNKLLKLVDEAGHELCCGETVTTFRGERLKLVSGRAPHKAGSTGRVMVKWPDGESKEFFPSVIRARWVAA